MIANRLRLLIVVALALSMSIWTFGPAAVAQITAPNTGQDVVRVVEGDWQTLSAGQQHWYRFDYAGNNLPIRIALDVNPSAGATFQVWTAAQFSQLATNTGEAPVAAGSQDVNDANLVLWQGSLADAGPHYVVIQPTGTTTTQYLLNIGGRGLSAAPDSGANNGTATDGGAIVAGAVNVNIRSGPSTAYSVLQTIPQGTQLTVLGQDASSTWLSVQLPDGTQGWIARFLTDFGGTVATVPTPALTPADVLPPLAPPASTATDVIVAQGTANVNMRTGPSTLYSVIRTLPQNTQLTVLGQDSTGTWLSVQLSDGTQGWIARYLTNYIGTAPVFAAPPLSAPTLAVPPLAAPPTTIDATGGAVVVSGAANVNVRTGPSTAYSVIRTVPQGTPLTVLGQDAANSWLWVRFADGTEGWIARFLTNYAGIAPTVSAPVLAQPSLAPAPTLNAAPQASLYVGPSTAYSIVRDVPSGSQITILGQESTGAWLWVRLSDGTEGWMARSVTDFTGTAPIVAAPSSTVPTVSQPPLAPPSTVVTVPGISGLPSEPASVHSFPVENALAANWQTLSAGQTRWFTFDSSGDEELIQIWMDVEPNDASGFHIFSESDARSIMAGANPDDFAPIGSGTPNPNESGDLFWRGAFTEHGRYFVMIDNPSTSDASFSIYGVGPGLGS
jgi:uncharacterized protein YraI